MSSQVVDFPSLEKKARQFRRDILQMIYYAKSGHPGGSLSAVEIFIALYSYKMRYRAQEPTWPDRDRLVISKGHASPVAYVALADAGFFKKEELWRFRKLGSILQGHVHCRTPGIEFNTGSLGQGLSLACGVALGAKLLKKDFQTYCLLGDGEIQEGAIWEAAMTAAHYKLDNLCAIVDYNKVQENGPTNSIKNLEPLSEKWKSFGWYVIEVDGHNITELMKALDTHDEIKEKPTVIIAHTVKGKGVPFMEGDCHWHGKAPNEEQLKEALEYLKDN